MITSNVHKDDNMIFLPERRFNKVASNLRDYVNLAEDVFNISSGRQGRDHFTHTKRRISELWNKYSREKNAESALSEINDDLTLKKWFAAVLCMAVYGGKYGYELDTVLYTSNNVKIPEIWKQKFDEDRTNDNDVEPDADGIKVYELSKNGDKWLLGCFSKRYGVIPPYEFIGTEDECKRLCNSVVRSCDLKSLIGIELSLNDQIKIKFTALSIPDDSPLRIIKDVLLSIIDLNIECSNDIPKRTVGSFCIFCCEDVTIPKKALCREIYMTKVNGISCALYPITKYFAELLENKAASANDLKMEIGLKNGEQIVKVNGRFCYKVGFMAPGEKDASIRIPYFFNDDALYDSKCIFSADGLGTFCTYPDIPVEYEYRCTQYIYIYDLSTNITNTGTPVDLELADMPCQNAYNFDKVSMISSKTPKHLFNVSLMKTTYSSQERFAGCIVNMRNFGRECIPPLMFTGNTVDIDLDTQPLPCTDTINVYMDFGSSSSAIGYKIGNGSPTFDDVTGGTPIVREVLGKYAPERYSCFMNLPSQYRKKLTVPTSIVQFAHSSYGTYRYDHMFLPFAHQYLEYEKNHLYVSGIQKQELTVRGKKQSDYVTAAIENLCYTAICHAINCSCNEVVFFQSFPNDEYKLAYHTLTTQYFDYVNRNIFPDINLKCLISCDNNFLLYESIAVLNGLDVLPNNVMLVSIDIGDSTTDLAAIYVNDGTKQVCGYSSIEYAGKNLLKGAVRDMLLDLCKSAQPSRANDMLKRIFYPLNGHENEFNDSIDALIKKFKKGIGSGGYLLNSDWENIFMEMLSICEVNIENCDDTFRSDLFFRYSAMLPVIRDFIETSLNSCNNPDGDITVNISFCGGGAKGFELLNSYDSNYFLQINDYMSMPGTLSINVGVSEGDSKKQLISGLEKLVLEDQHNGNYNVLLADIQSIKVNWRDIDPKYTASFISPRRQEKCRRFNIVPLSESSDIGHNEEQRKVFSNFFKDDGIKELLQLSESVIEYFLQNTSGRKSLLSLFSKRSDIKYMSDYKRTANSGVNDVNSFVKASASEVYPEMVHNLAVLFEIDRVLNENRLFL